MWSKIIQKFVDTFGKGQKITTNESQLDFNLTQHLNLIYKKIISSYSGLSFFFFSTLWLAILSSEKTKILVFHSLFYKEKKKIIKGLNSILKLFKLKKKAFISKTRRNEKWKFQRISIYNAYLIKNLAYYLINYNYLIKYKYY